MRPTCFIYLLLSLASVHADMMKDTTVKFPEKGALPSKYPPDVTVPKSIQAGEGWSISENPTRSLEQIRTVQGVMPAGKLPPIPADWTYQPRTHKTLTEGGKLHILAVGDSIVADTMRSGWVNLVREKYPKAEITAQVSMRGSTGCWFYKDEDRVAKQLAPLKPDLIFIGGISQRGDIESIRSVIQQFRAKLPQVEFLLATGAFGTADPRVPEELAKAQHTTMNTYGTSLKELAQKEHCAFLDVTTPWAAYINSTGLHPHAFYRDRVHANAEGEQILAKIFLSFFSQP